MPTTFQRRFIFMQAEQHEDYAAITLPEVIDLINAPDFKNVLRTLYDQDCNNIRIDCSHLKMIDAAGIGSLTLYQKKFKDRGGELKLVNVKDNHVKHVFHMLDLRKVLTIEEIDAPGS